ncbi:hypothetical protein ACFVU2_21300 [Leifsonia sp. NPDC058194]|uniref:hypothetical protein n=1 Tax=Leifsonia sp. NPDC058194 TaxID=3346374 RepID=UPI0036D9F28B
MDKPKWNRTLEPYARLYAEHLAQMEERLRAMSEEEFNEFETAVAQPSQTNVWWATYRAARLIDPLVRDERRRRNELVSTPDLESAEGHGTREGEGSNG